MNIGIIGVGRLGLCYALMLEQQGFNVFASSYKQDYIDRLKLKQSDSVEPGVADLVAQTNINFTVDNHYVIANCDMLYVMVATPSNERGDYDVTAVEQVANDFLTYTGSVANKILIIGSTVNPGDCERVQKQLNHLGINVVYSPTFAAQGTVLRDITNPHNLLIGTENPHVAQQCHQVFVKIIGESTPVHCVHSTTAEILKLANNCKSTLAISYFNMIGEILINSGMVNDMSAASKFLNSGPRVAWSPGYGYGGPCYPRDNRAFAHYTQTLGIDYPLGKVVDKFNQEHADFLFNYFVKDNVENLPYYFEYLSYKPGVNIFEESQQLQVCRRLLDAGHTVYVEPSVYLLSKIREDLSRDYTWVNFETLTELTARGQQVYNASNLIKKNL
jgi:nucleotide sugar dehydrogenase